MALAVVAAFMPAAALAQPEVTARGAIIVDADTGAVIWEMNADEPLPPASTTKVMTAVLALQSHRLDQEFMVSSNAAATPPSKIGLRPGQSVALRDLLYAVLLKSANDAAVVVAEGVSGSELAFANQMNLKARVVGATSTNFVNPHGLTESGHLTTARDLSRIFRYGLGVPGFREVLSTTSAEVEIDGPDARLTIVRSHNRLLNAPDYQVIGKTGYTRPARRCFVGAAGQGSREVVIAILGATDLWGDARRMLYYGMRPDRPTPVLRASATPPPTAAEPEVAVARAAPATEVRAAPASPEPEPPSAFARAESSAAPEAAVARAARMARARGEDSQPVREDDAPVAPAQPEAVPAPPEPRQVAAPPAPSDLDREPAREAVEPADVPPARVQPVAAPAPAAVAPQPVAAPSPAALDEPRDEPHPAAGGEPADPGAGARRDATEPPARDREADRDGGPSLWADSPLRQPGEAQPRAVQPARPVEEATPEPPTPAARPKSTRRAPADRGVERERTKPTTVAKAAGKPAPKPTRAELQAARTQDRRGATRVADSARRSPARGDVQRKAAAESTRTASRAERSRATRDDRGDGRPDQVARTRSASDPRPSRMTAKGLEADRAGTSRTGRGGRRSADTEVADVASTYTVQLGPYRDRKAVDSARSDLAKRGYEARVVGQKLELGNFAERKRADKLASQLRVKGHPAKSAQVR